MEHQIAEQAREDLNRLSELVRTWDLPPDELTDAAHRIQRLERIILSGVRKILVTA